MKIRKAQKKDLDEIYKLCLELFKSEDASSSKVGKFLRKLRLRRVDFKSSTKKELLRELRQKDSLYLVAEKDGELVGYIRGEIFNVKDPFFKPQKIGYLHAMVTKKEYRSKGVSNKLYAEMLKWFKKKKCAAVSLEVFATNPAVKVYKKWGYKIATYKMWKKI
ncbi:GNAT family N-acetyltransferase [Candidatus Woesearchaeota archaeon]|nr:GNAT family N-acetyltransferase [Candidatus Woesearchaeota archaeon]